MMAGAAVEAFSRGDFRRGRKLSGEAVQDVRMSPRPGVVLSSHFMFVHPNHLAAEVSRALQILDEVGADPSEYAEVHAVAAAMAATFGNIAFAHQEAALAVEISRRLGIPATLGVGLRVRFGILANRPDRSPSRPGGICPDFPAWGLRLGQG
jgi:hypothetical protein